MGLLQKGSALPRGLSSLERVYLAPVSDISEADKVSVAIKFSSGKLFLADFSVTVVEDWARGEADAGSNILDQLGHLNKFHQRKIVLGIETPLIMGIVNVTPDSFSDGGLFRSTEAAYLQAKNLRDAGAHILDIGGESTRPGADPVSVDEELARVLPVIEECSKLKLPISIDTRKSEVMEKAINAGAGLINDVTALEFDRDSLHVAAENKIPVCLMHSSADPKVMQDNPVYEHVLFDVIDYLKERVEICLKSGLTHDQIIIDPGIGFGKTLEHNLTLLKGLRFFHAIGCPVLLGVSRKSFISKIDRSSEVADRVAGSLSALLYGLSAGVQIFRVHDVEETRQAISVWQSIDKSDLTL